jgi:hypothetical protein
MGIGSRRLVTSAFSLVLCVPCSITVARAAEAPSAEDVKAAEADFSRGRDAYKKGDYVEAAEYFESADAHAPNERVLELSITARERAGSLDRAATLAQYGLETYPNSEKLRKIGEPLVAKAKVDLLEVTVECDEACSVLDGTRLLHGAPTTKRTVYLTPGDHTIRASWSNDRAAAKPVGGAGGAHADVAFAAPPIPVKEEPTPFVAVDPMVDSGGKRKSGLPPVVFWVGVGTTAVLGGVTTWSAIDTKNNPGADAVRDACAGQGESCPEYKDGRSRQTRTNILIGATSVVGVATALVGIFATNWGGGTPPPSQLAKKPEGLSVSPWISYSNGATVGATGRF